MSLTIAFNLGPVEGLEPSDVKQYIRHIADRRLLQLGLKPNYGVKDNPLEWVDWVVSGVEHTNFFENKATEYAKGTLTGTWVKVLSWAARPYLCSGVPFSFCV